MERIKYAWTVSSNSREVTVSTWMCEDERVHELGWQEETREIKHELFLCHEPMTLLPPLIVRNLGIKEVIPLIVYTEALVMSFILSLPGYT